MPRVALLCRVAPCCLSIAGCGDKSRWRRAPTRRQRDGSLPTPEGRARFVTGMPTRAPGLASRTTTRDRGGPEDIAIDDRILRRRKTRANERHRGRTPNRPHDDAVQAIQHYYDAIRAKDLRERLCRCGATAAVASGQTPEQFAAGFADTEPMSS
jgi:hypothetical protein